ncbi:dephospho-CoA kinase [Isosphaeraceae bacterium EP7]
MAHPTRNESESPRSSPGPWLHGLIPVIGLIGGIGSGKSRVAALLAEHDGFVIDADKVGHALLDQSPARDSIREHFGPSVFAEPEGPDELAKVDRKALGRIVFSNPNERLALEDILHPAMRRTFEKAIGRVLRRKQHRMIILDAAVLLEAGWADLCDLVIFVDSPESARIERVATSRGWTADELKRREASQLSVDRKRVSVDRVLLNHGDEEQLRATVDQFWADLKAENRKKHGEAAIRRQVAAAKRADRSGPTPGPGGSGAPTRGGRRFKPPGGPRRSSGRGNSGS